MGGPQLEWGKRGEAGGSGERGGAGVWSYWTPAGAGPRDSDPRPLPLRSCGSCPELRSCPLRSCPGAPSLRVPGAAAARPPPRPRPADHAKKQSEGPFSLDCFGGPPSHPAAPQGTGGGNSPRDCANKAVPGTRKTFHGTGRCPHAGPVVQNDGPSRRPARGPGRARTSALARRARRECPRHGRGEHLAWGGDIQRITLHI